MAEEIRIDEHNTVMVFEGAIATFANSEKPKKPVDELVLSQAAEKIALWGTDNDLPQLIITELDKNSDLKSLLHLQARVMYAGGVRYELQDPTTGKPLEKQKDKDIDNFLKRSWHYPIQASEDFYRFLNFFPQFTVNQEGDKIKWLTAQPANYCRYSIQNKKTGKSDKCYVNTDWSDGKPEDSDTEIFNCLDPIFEDADYLHANKGEKRHWIYGMTYPQGKLHYAIPNFWALKKSKWLELANKIPLFKLALMNNQVTIKYHIQFPDTHWDFICPGFDKLSKVEKLAIKTTEIKKIVDLLQGEENAGKSIVTGYQVEKISGKEFPGIKIDAIDDKIKDGIYLEDSVEATIKLFTALGLDPALLGIVPGKGGSNRSGNDKKAALNAYISLIQPHIDLVLKPYEFISDYNLWNNDAQTVRWYFEAPLLQMLDQITPSQRETTTSNPTDSE
jgi:hypothetical protein